MEIIAHPIPDAAKISGQSRTRIYNLLSEGKLRAVKSGKRTLILAASLREYVASLPAYKPSR